MAKKSAKYPKQVPFTKSELKKFADVGWRAELDGDDVEVSIDNYVLCISKSEVEKGLYTYPVVVLQDGELIDEEGMYGSFKSLIEDLDEPYDDLGHFKFLAA